MKRFSTIVALVLSAVLCGSLFTACGNKESETGMNEAGEYIISVYRARSSGMVDGKDDEMVTEAIEEKFKEDTGIGIDLRMTLLTNTDLPQKVDLDFSKKDQPMDLVFHYTSEDVGSAILKYAKESESVHEVESLLEEYGQNVLKAIRQNDTDHIAEKTGYVMQQDGSLKMTIIPGVYTEKQYGILLRKDYMRAVQAETGLDPDEYDVANDGYKNMTIAEFDNLLRAMADSSALPDIQYPITGYPWDISRVIGTSYGVDSMNYGFRDGKVVPPQLTENFDRYIQIMYEWARDGIWAPDSNNKSETQMRSDFMVGKTAVFIAYPEINNLIGLHRQCRAMEENSEAEYMMLAPLAESDENGDPVLDENNEPVVHGFMKNNKAFGGVILPMKSKNPEITVQFLNWMFASQDNYDLCKYGIKGTHWIEGPEKTINGVTYKTWEYPLAKYDEYTQSPPYSGMWELLPNLNVSNRVRSDLMDIEMDWYVACTETNEALPSATEGVWLPKVARSFSMAAQTVDGEYVDNVRSYAWTGKENNGKTPMELLEEYLTNINTTCADYLDAINNNYMQAKAALDEKFAD